MAGGASSGRGGMRHGQGSPHPVSVAFPGPDSSHVATEQYGVASSTGCAGGVSVCVKDAANPAAGAHVRLFGRPGAYRVECSSCHDPHQDNRTGAHPQLPPGPEDRGRRQRLRRLPQEVVPGPATAAARGRQPGDRRAWRDRAALD